MEIVLYIMLGIQIIFMIWGGYTSHKKGRDWLTGALDCFIPIIVVDWIIRR